MKNKALGTCLGVHREPGSIPHVKTPKCCGWQPLPAEGGTTPRHSDVDRLYPGWHKFCWTAGNLCSANTNSQTRTECVWMNQAAWDLMPSQRLFDVHTVDSGAEKNEDRA